MSKEAFLAHFEKYYDQFSSLDKTSFYEYEKGWEKIIVNAGRDVLESSVNEGIMSKDRRIKKK
jgi:hypothetical protein